MKLTVESRHVQEVRANIFYLALLSLVTIVLWIGLGIYHSYTVSKSDAEIQKLIIPLTPNLDVKVARDYAASRQPAPDTFKITYLQSSKDSDKKTLQVLDPFTNQITTPASRSASARP